MLSDQWKMEEREYKPLEIRTLMAAIVLSFLDNPNQRSK
jgi:hypothetical protein